MTGAVTDLDLPHVDLHDPGVLTAVPPVRLRSNCVNGLVSLPIGYAPTAPA